MAKSKTQQVAEKTLFATFEILKEAGGELRGKEVLSQIPQRVELNEYERHVYEKTGNTRWRSVLHFYTIDCIKAGFMRKHKGNWILTDEGEQAMKLGPEKLLLSATNKYREWDAKRKKDAPADQLEFDDVEEVVEGDKGQAQKARLDQFEEEASNGIREFIF